MDRLEEFELTAPDHWKEQEIKVCLIGAGGNGSEMMDCLIRIAKGLEARGSETGLSVVVIDDDLVEPQNLIRQRFWPSDVGIYKSQSVVEKANYLLGMDWNFIPGRIPLAGESCLPKGETFDIVITCVDNVAARITLYESYKDKQSETIWLDMGNEATDGQVVIGHLGVCKTHVPNVLERFPEIKTMKDEHKAPSCSAEESLRRQDLFINQKVASAAGNMLWQLIAKGKIANTHIHIDAKKMEELTIG